MTDEHLAVVRGLLDGTDLLPGLSIDTDLRWHLLHQLVAAGLADDAEIERELDADDTATGRRQAAAALAARPTAAAKAEAWSSVVDGDELPNAIQTAIIGGFSQVGPARPAAALRRAVLRVADPDLGRADQRDRAERRHRPVPDAARRAGHGRRRRRLARGAPRRGAGAAPAGRRVPRRRGARAARPGPRRPQLTERYADAAGVPAIRGCRCAATSRSGPARPARGRRR